MTRAAILNVTGYAGAELARLLHSHPGVELVAVTGRAEAGKKLAEIFPHLRQIDLAVGERVDESVDLVFSALPHTSSAEGLIPFIRQGIPVVDLSADFRIKNSDTYRRFYGVDHPAPELLGGAVYGLPEVTRKPEQGARIVGNPGCYAAGALLALAPGVAAGLFGADIVIDGKSGISGAGRTLGQPYHFAEANDSVSAYAMEGEGHRHRPEIDQELGCLRGKTSKPVAFVPHLVPLTRGILTTVFAQVVRNVAQAELMDAYCSFYEGSTFVGVVESPPSTKQVAGTNNCLIHVRASDASGKAIVVSAIDNLGRGAAGQAVQNMNRVLGLPETMGLEQLALYP
jgi:N-acetyl-gamma-glutamyl-phosphate reductase